MKFNINEKDFKKYFTILIASFLFVIAIVSFYYLSDLFPTMQFIPDYETTDKSLLNNKVESVDTEILQVFNSTLKPVGWNQTVSITDSIMFTFNAREISNTGNATVDGFNCRFDTEESSPCVSPLGINNTAIGTGQHTFEVFAEDNEGNDDPSPAVFLWNVK